MDVLIIGLGSMGKRRLGLLQKNGSAHHLTGVDARPERRKEAEETFHIETFDTITGALTKYSNIQCAFICTSPLSHHVIIRECLEKGLNIFTEINLVTDGYETNIRLAEERKKVLFLSSTFLYREEIQFIQRELSELNERVNYVYHVGQYLPDWHPWENIKEFFVGDKRTNGCREIFAIELPWITETFGDIQAVISKHDRLGKLQIPYDDNYFVEVIHENGNKGLLIVDVVSPKAVRNLELYNENLYICWDGTPGGLKKYNRTEKSMEEIIVYDSYEHKKDYQPTIIEDAYAKEISDFFKVINGEMEQKYGFEKDLKILQWIDEIEA